MDNNAYLLTCTVTGTAVLIDAASEAGRLIELIGSTPGDPDRPLCVRVWWAGATDWGGRTHGRERWERSRRATRSTGFRGIPARSFRN